MNSVTKHRKACRSVISELSNRAQEAWLVGVWFVKFSELTDKAQEGLQECD